MYIWLFNHLPGPRWTQVLLAVALLLAAVLVLFEVVFPWAEQFSPLTRDVTIGDTRYPAEG